MTNTVHSSQHWLVLVQPAESSPAPYSLEMASRLTGVHSDLLRHYCRIGLLGAARTRQDAALVFDDHALYEVRRIEHIRRHEGVNLRALTLVCNLLRELEQLRTELRFHRHR